jgi:hypothetical protein
MWRYIKDHADWLENNGYMNKPEAKPNVAPPAPAPVEQPAPEPATPAPAQELQ